MLNLLSVIVFAMENGNDNNGNGNVPVQVVEIPLFDEPIDASLFFSLCAVIIRSLVIHGTMMTLTALIYRF